MFSNCSHFTGFALEGNTSFDETFLKSEVGQIAILGNRSGIICEKRPAVGEIPLCPE
jgi:hypothetical protein